MRWMQPKAPNLPITRGGRAAPRRVLPSQRGLWDTRESDSSPADEAGNFPVTLVSVGGYGDGCEYPLGLVVWTFEPVV